MCTLVEILPFIQVIMVVIQEFYLQPALDLFLESLVETSHVYFVALYVREALFVQEKLTDAAELPVIMLEFSPPLYYILPL
jgi:hypothetical protein